MREGVVGAQAESREKARDARGNGVVAAVTPGVATQQAPGRQRGAGGGPVGAQGIERVLRTRGLEAAGVAQPGLEQIAVALHEPDQGLARPVAR